MLNIIKMLLLEGVAMIDRGECNNIGGEEQYQLVMSLKEFFDARKELSRTEAAKYLNIGQSTFDRRVIKGMLPRGIKKPGRAPYWTKKMLDNIK